MAKKRPATAEREQMKRPWCWIVGHDWRGLSFYGLRCYRCGQRTRMMPNLPEPVERACLGCGQVKQCHPILGICALCLRDVWLPAREIEEKRNGEASSTT